MKIDKLGRPTIGFSHINKNHLRHYFGDFDLYVTFMTTNDVNNKLKELAKKKGISKAELIRTYIEWGLENDK